jgi:hypothetical protein
LPCVFRALLRGSREETIPGRNPTGKERPSAGEKQGQFSEAEPGGFGGRLGNNVRHFEQSPQKEIEQKDPHAQHARDWQQESNRKKDHQHAGRNGKRGPRRKPRGNRLPDEGKIPVDHSQDTKPG